MLNFRGATWGPSQLSTIDNSCLVVGPVRLPPKIQKSNLRELIIQRLKLSGITYLSLRQVQC